MAKEISLEVLSTLLGGQVSGDKSCLIGDVGSFNEAKEGEITFVASSKLIKEIPLSKASAFIVTKEAADRKEIDGRNLIVVTDVYLAFARAVEALRPAPTPEPGINPKAEIHPSAKLGKDVTVMAFAVIEADVKIAESAVIYPGVYIGRDSSVGEKTIIYSNASIREDSSIGRDVIIHANAVIGSDGFGYAKDKDKYVKIPQRGSVRVEDNCEIGASTTIDRGTIGETVIGRGTKIDNLAQIAHNVVIGENSVLTAQVGISGSTVIGKRVQIGGQAGVVGHIEVGDDSSIGAKSAVLQSVPPGTTYSGYPAIPHSLWLRTQSIIKKLPEIKKTLKELETRQDKDKK
jgi:UDP-3-O-[3-hydroxymyristoyl] glucosamine N-acyltransferase